MVVLHATSDVVIGASPAQVFDLLNPERTPEWDRSVVAVAAIDGPLARGAKYRETHRIFLRENAIEFEVTEYEPDLKIACRTLRGGPSSSTRYELAGRPDATEVRMAVDARIAGPLVFLAPLLRRVMKRQLPETLASLKSYCETHVASTGTRAR